MAVTERWYSPRLERELTVARWGEVGQPVLLFPTAGGDATEVERQGLVDACGELLAAGRVKLYSCDSVAGRALLERSGSAAHRTWLLDRFQAAVAEEVIPAMHADSGGRTDPVVAAGASIGAFNAVAMVCRRPDLVRAAIGMSGTYDLLDRYEGWSDDRFHLSSPLHFLPDLGGDTLELLRHRFVLLASGRGAWEDVGESWRMAEVLGAKGVPNRVDDWGPDVAHDWPTWRRMLPVYLDELVA